MQIFNPGVATNHASTELEWWSHAQHAGVHGVELIGTRPGPTQVAALT
jgi:hypothetical protein